MAEPRFRVTSCTGYTITPETAAGSMPSSSGASSSWQVLDSAVGFALVSEFIPDRGHSEKFSEAMAREHAEALNVWDASGSGEPAPSPNPVPPSKRLAYRHAYQRARRARLRP